MQRLAMPLIEPATEATLMIEPPPPSIMAGRKALIIRAMA